MEFGLFHESQDMKSLIRLLPNRGPWSQARKIRRRNRRAHRVSMLACNF
jgi:hypothetical protein